VPCGGELHNFEAKDRTIGARVKRHSGEHDRPREARLRSASAHLYPGITPEVWIQAATMADIVWSRRLQQGTGSIQSRVLDGAHFEFRNEGSPPTDPTLRRRATDRLRLQGD
jgi:hypothetical protein